MQPSLNASLSRLLIENKHGRINNSLLQSFCIMNDWRDLPICIMRCYSIAGLSPSSNAWRSLNREKLDLQRIWIFPLPPRCYDFYAPCDTECIFQAWMEEVINKASVYLGGKRAWAALLHRKWGISLAAAQVHFPFTKVPPRFATGK